MEVDIKKTTDDTCKKIKKLKKKTSTKMEDNLKKNGIRPQRKWKTTSTKMEDNLKKIKKMEDNLNHNIKNQP
jgi:hypothetical protein